MVFDSQRKFPWMTNKILGLDQGRETGTNKTWIVSYFEVLHEYEGSKYATKLQGKFKYQ